MIPPLNPTSEILSRKEFLAFTIKSWSNPSKPNLPSDSSKGSFYLLGKDPIQYGQAVLVLFLLFGQLLFMPVFSVAATEMIFSFLNILLRMMVAAQCLGVYLHLGTGSTGCHLSVLIYPMISTPHLRSHYEP